MPSNPVLIGRVSLRIVILFPAVRHNDFQIIPDAIELHLPAYSFQTLGSGHRKLIQRCRQKSDSPMSQLVQMFCQHGTGIDVIQSHRAKPQLLLLLSYDHRGDAL